LDSDPSSCPLANTLADRKAHAGSGILRVGVETFEYAKDLPVEPRLDADPVILHGEQPALILKSGGNLYPWRRTASSVANRVPDQILKQLFQLKLAHTDTRESPCFD
jgi:hypothetical protein